MKSAANLWPEEFNVQIDNQYQQVLDAVSESIHTLFLQWIKTIPKVKENSIIIVECVLIIIIIFTHDLITIKNPTLTESYCVI